VASNEGPDSEDSSESDEERNTVQFSIPSPATRRDAIGIDNKRLPAVKRAILEPDDALFPPIKEPKQGDWLAEFSEDGQTFAEFNRSRKKSKKAQTKNIICLLPIGDFDPNHSPSLETLQQFASKYFCMEVQLLAPLVTEKKKKKIYVLILVNAEDTLSKAESIHTPKSFNY